MTEEIYSLFCWSETRLVSIDGSFFHLAKSETDACFSDFRTFGEGVKPVGLNFSGHDEEAAVFELGADALLGHGVLEVELSLRAEAEAGNGGVFDDG